MADILVLGAGAMGSAITVPLADAGHATRLVGTHLDTEIIASIRRTRCHPRLRTNLPETLAPYTHDQLGEAIRKVDLVILGVSSAGIDWAAERLRDVLPQQVPLIVLTKGLRGDGNSIEILPRVLEARLGPGQSGRICAIAGPCIAGELAVRRQTSVVLAGRERALAERLSNMMRTPYYHLTPSVDLIGVEVCAALKNFFALGVGTAAGMLERSPAVDNLARMHNPASTLFTQAIYEMTHLVGTLGGLESTVQGLAGVGDLYVTCQAGRNSRMGKWLGLGLTYSEAKTRHMSEDTVEGAETAAAIGPTIEAMIDSGKLDGAMFPLTRAILNTVCLEALLEIPWDRFFGG